MLSRLLIIASLAFTLFQAGCASQHSMATLDEKSAAKPTKAVYLLTVTLKNSFVPAYQPKLESLKLQKLVQSEYPVIQIHNVDHLGKNETLSPATGNSYLVRLELEPGEYRLLGLNSVGQSMFITSPYFTPILGRISVREPGFFYLGHIDATIRERKSEEFHAGGLLPTQEQRLTGGFGGTWDISIVDQWAEDQGRFQNRFPALAKASVQKATLTPFNRGSAQAWWDFNNFKEVPNQ
ncbi:MAG: hypothetical protein QM715_07265 [Nibricoccus sp.]